MTTTRRMLAPLRPAARILTGSTYALLGFDALRAPGARVDQAAPMLAAVRAIVPLPADEALLASAPWGPRAGRVDQAAPMRAAGREIVPLPADDALVVRGNAAAQVLGGALLALGRAPRLSALVLDRKRVG